MGYKISALTAAGSAPALTDLFEISRVSTPYVSRKMTFAELASAWTTGFSMSGASITNNVITGKAGGQTFYGDTASGGNMTLSSTIHATKGKIIIGTSAYDEVNNRLGLGTTTPTAVMHLKAGASGAGSAPLKFTSGTNLTTPEAGAIEFNGSELYWTQNTTRMVLFSNRGNSDNMFCGKNIANTTLSGDGNVIFGSTLATGLTSGADNVLIGRGASTGITSGSSNVVIGGGISCSNVSGFIGIGAYVGLTIGSVANSIWMGRDVMFGGTIPSDSTIIIGSYGTCQGSFGNSAGIGYRTTLSASNQLNLGSSEGSRYFTDVLIGGSENTAFDRSSATTIVWRLPNMYSSSAVANLAARVLAIKGAVSTGNASTGGDIEFHTTNAGAAGTTLNSYVKRLTISGVNGYITIASLPTAAAGLPAGTLWNNLGIVNVAP